MISTDGLGITSSSQMVATRAIEKENEKRNLGMVGGLGILDFEGKNISTCLLLCRSGIAPAQFSFTLV